MATQPNLTILAYDSQHQIGGTTTWLKRFLPALRENGIEAQCFLLRHCAEQGSTETYLRREGFRTASVVAPLFTEQRLEWILTEFNRSPTDIFFSNEVLAGYFLTPVLKAQGVATIGILHSDCAHCRGMLDLFVNGTPEYKLDALVCVSEALERLASNNNPQCVKIRRIPCGVPIPKQYRDRKDDRLRLVYLGRLCEEAKQISRLARTLCRVASLIPGVDARLFGDGPEKENIARIIEEASMQASVRIEGPIHPESVTNALLESDALVLLSEYEGMPVCVMEAMAAGVVPICLRTESGIPELISSGVDGLIVENCDEEFNEAVARLQSDLQLWGRLSLAARQTAIARFSEDVCIDRWKQLLHSLSSGARPSITARHPPSLPEVHPLLKDADSRIPGSSPWALRLLLSAYRKVQAWRRLMLRRGVGDTIHDT